MVRVIDPVSDIEFYCEGQSFMRTPGEILSLVRTEDDEVRIICYNQADNKVTTIHDYGNYDNVNDNDFTYDSDKYRTDNYGNAHFNYFSD